MREKKHSIYIISVLLVMLVLLLSACSADQSCDHQQLETSCTSPEPCPICGSLDGVTITHQWREDAEICNLCGLDKRPTDVRFMESLAKGLDVKWELINATENKKTTSREDFEKLFHAEYNLVSEYKGTHFENAELEELAHQYIDSVIAARDALVYYDTDQWADQYENSIYHEQTVILFKIHTLSPVPVAEKTQDYLQDLLKNGETIHMVSQLFDDVYFHKIKNPNGTYRYEALVENITSLRFSSFSFEVHLLDENKNLLAIETIKETNWKPGEERWFKFYPDVEFDIIDVRYADWKF